MHSSLPDQLCPACQQVDVIEHIDVSPIEDRIKGVDRRCTIDLAYLSLIEVDRRKNRTDRRNVDIDNMVVEHHELRNMVCLACAHEWHTDGSSGSLVQ